MQHLTAKQLHERLQQQDEPPFLLDVREPWEYNLCAIEHSELIPMGQIASALDRLDPERETVVICHHGIRSRSVAMFLERNGFTNLYNLTGGVESWSRDVDLDMPTY
jgi:rhodanese-related sulfurtransferase